MLTLGMDEAGKGPVIGPLVLAGCLIDDKTALEFKRLGIKDSKELTQKRREVLAEKIRDMAETFEIRIIPPIEIDGNGCDERTKLNELEGIIYADIINKINKGYEKIRVVIDCPSPSINKWSDFVRNKIKDNSTIELVCEHKADKNHLAVSAASILAKSIREKEMGLLKEKFGDEIGSGYCSDPATQRFVERFAKKHKDSGIFRKTWITWKVAYQNLEQRKLF
jgi:ribonuclease HII